MKEWVRGSLVLENIWVVVVLGGVYGMFMGCLWDGILCSLFV